MKYANIGGQAVMEGVMMRHKDHYAVAVRKENHEIEVMTEQRQTLGERYHVSGIPIVRGVFAFVDSLVVGMKTLMWSASFFEDEEETSQEKEKQSDTVFMTMTVIFSLAFSIGLFMILPFFVSNLFKIVTDSSLVLGIIELTRYIIIFYTVYLVKIGNIEIGTILLIYSYYDKILTNFEVLGTITADYQSFIVSLKRINKIISLSEEVVK